MGQEHKEKHFKSSDTLRDIIIGMADGLTVPFALAAGLTGVIESTSVIVIAGLAEISAGSIAMGLGGYLAAKSDAEHYESEKLREENEVKEIPDAEEAEIIEILKEYNVDETGSKPFVEALKKNPDKWVDFMMKYELGLEKPEPKRARNSASTIALSYIIGGLIPLSPYIFIPKSGTALVASILITLLALGVFGYVKGRFTGLKPFRKAVQMMLTGGLAAAAAFFIAKLIS
jgi:vacuolar iron transporter family protein